jgi:hypothetical protein
MKRYFNGINPERNGQNLFKNRSILELELAYDFAYFVIFLGAANSMQVRNLITPHAQ